MVWHGDDLLKFAHISLISSPHGGKRERLRMHPNGIKNTHKLVLAVCCVVTDGMAW